MLKINHLITKKTIYLFIYLTGANKTEHFLTDGEEQHESSKLHENKFVLHIL